MCIWCYTKQEDHEVDKKNLRDCSVQESPVNSVAIIKDRGNSCV